MDDEQKVDGISARLAERADRQLKQDVANGLQTFRNEFLGGEVYDVTLEMPLCHVEVDQVKKTVRVGLRRVLTWLENDLFDALRTDRQKQAYRAFLDKFDELKAGLEEIQNREE